MKYIVEIIQTETYTFELEADSKEEVRRKAWDIMATDERAEYFSDADGEEEIYECR